MRKKSVCKLYCNSYNHQEIMLPCPASFFSTKRKETTSNLFRVNKINFRIFKMGDKEKYINTLVVSYNQQKENAYSAKGIYRHIQDV